MKKQDKINFINKVNSFFVDAKNHGNNGNNWWYPKPNRIAYNVKMREFFSVSKLEPMLSKRQREYYNDNTLYSIAEEQLNDEAMMLIDDIQVEYGLSSNYAGRSGGWLEVDFNNPLEDVIDNEVELKNLSYYYKEAKKLEKLEQDVRQFIEQRHKALNVYMSTDRYYKDLLERLSDDKEIADIYKTQAKSLLDKLN